MISMFINTTEKRFKLTDIISYIGVNESTRRLIIQVKTFLNFLFSLIGDKQAAEEIHSFPSLELSKHEIV